MSTLSLGGLALSASAVVGATMPDIAPSFDAPWMPTLTNITSMMLGTFLVVLTLGLGAGALIWVIGKLAQSGRAQEVGITFFVWTLVGAAVIAGVSGFIGWAMGLPLF